MSDLLVRFQTIYDAALKQRKVLFITGVSLYCLTGLLTLYSASSGYATANFTDAAYFVKKQMLFILLGAATFGALQKFSVDRLAKIKIRWWLIACLGVAVYATVAGFSQHGVRGWFQLLNIPFRAGDIIILLHLLLLVSVYFYDQEKFNGRNFPKIILLIQLSAWFLTYSFPDRGTFVVILLVSMFVLLALGRYAAFWAIACFHLALITLYSLTVKYALVRFTNIGDTLLLNRPDDLSYQIIIAIEKMIAGGFWGQWDYLTVEAGQLLPEAHLGFIFVYFVRNAGLAGTILLMAFLLLLLVIAIKPLKTRKLTYPSLLTLVFCGLFSSQCLIGMSTAVGLFPGNNIGIPVFSLHPLKTIGAFITFGLLYRQLNSVCTEPGWKTYLTEPLIRIHIFVFALIILKISYHMVKEFV